MRDAVVPSRFRTKQRRYSEASRDQGGPVRGWFPGSADVGNPHPGNV